MAIPTDRVPRSHLAVVREPFARAIIDGTKTIESRLSQTRQRPFASVAIGDRLLVKISGGPVVAETEVVCVRYFADLTPGRVRGLRRLFGEEIGAPAGYWHARRSARYATLVWLSGVRELVVPRTVPRLFGAAWVVLDDGGTALRAVRGQTSSRTPTHRSGDRCHQRHVS